MHYAPSYTADATQVSRNGGISQAMECGIFAFRLKPKSLNP